MSPNPKGGNLTSEHVNTPDWVNHFTSIFYEKNVCLPHNTMNNGPLDYQITTKEMMAASSNLKSGKSPGLDNLTNEMINCAIQIYPQSFLYLFNHILNNGGYIPSWS